MKLNWSHNVYIILQNFPGMVLAAFALYVVMILMTRKLFGCCSCHRLDECSQKLFFMIPEIIFGPPKGVINFEPSRTSETHIIYVGNNKVRKKVYISLWLLATTFIFSTIIVFWDLFLLNESYTCEDKTVDCFAFVSNESIQYQPVDDCSICEDTDASFVCFEFKFSIGTALAVVGGLLTGMRIITKIISQSFTWLYNNSHEKKCCSCNRFTCIRYALISLDITWTCCSEPI